MVSRDVREAKCAGPQETPARWAVKPLPSPLPELSATAILAGWQGLVNLFGVELWERYSFYGMLAILGYLYYSVTDGGLELPKSTVPGG